jgi:dihydroxyacetone kinase
VTNVRTSVNALGYNEVQRKVAATVLFVKANERFADAGDKYDQKQ